MLAMATRKNKAKIIIRCVLLVKVAVIFCPFRNMIMRITINTALRDSLAFRAHIIHHAKKEQHKNGRNEFIENQI